MQARVHVGRDGCSLQIEEAVLREVVQWLSYAAVFRDAEQVVEATAR